MSDRVQVTAVVHWHALLDSLVDISRRLDRNEVSDYDVKRVQMVADRLKGMRDELPTPPGEER